VGRPVFSRTKPCDDRITCGRPFMEPHNVSLQRIRKVVYAPWLSLITCGSSSSVAEPRGVTTAGRRPPHYLASLVGRRLPERCRI
jgi:hypothetical protein